MQTNGRKIWFPAKKYGWGWGFPCCWQGWVVFAVWLILLICGAGIFLIVPQGIGWFVLYNIVLNAALFIVVLLKGEKPRWRWGRR